MTNDISTIRQEYSTSLPDWQKVRHVVSGERAVKEAGDTYLPRPNPFDESTENEARYDQYVERAVFFNATARTLSGLIGIAFRRLPEVALSPAMEVLLDDTDGAGGGLFNQVHRTLEDTLGTGRGGLLVDFPQREASASLAEQRAENLHPIITHYPPESIINWRVGGGKRLTLVVLYEVLEVEDGYGVAQVEQWRELTLADGVYTQRLWQRPDNSGAPEIKEEFVPKDAKGNAWAEIPFQFVGSNDNNPDLDRAPLLDLAGLNIAHYRSSANYFESEFFHGQPTFSASGLDESWIADVWKDGNFYVGARAIIPLPVGGQLNIVQAQPNTLSSEAMTKLEQQMVALGARLLIQGEVAKTADQNRSETAAAHSVLSLACDNVSAAYTKALQWAAAFSGDNPEDVAFAIHTDFTGLLADPNLLTALVKGWQAGAYPSSDLWAALRQLGIIDPDKTDEELEEEIDEEGGGLELDAPLSQFDAQQQNAPDGGAVLEGIAEV